MKEYHTGQIRNIALVSHNGAGKTTLVERVLFNTGVLTRMGSVQQGTAAMDYDEEEINRNSSVSMSLAAIEWNDLKFVFGGDTYPNVWFAEYAKGADLAIHECWMTSDDMMTKYNQPAQLALRINLKFHTSAQSFGQIMSMAQPRHAVAYHFFNDDDTRYKIYGAVRENYDGPLSIAMDMMVWNISRDGVTERMAVSPDSA